MSRELTLPNGETVTDDDVFLYNNYPYRVKFPDEGAERGNAGTPADGARQQASTGESSADESGHEFLLSPLYWGGGEMDVPFRDRDALVEQWGPDSRGTLAPEEWEAWLREVRHDDRFGDEELDALARELPVSGGGLMARIRQAFGF